MSIPEAAIATDQARFEALLARHRRVLLSVVGTYAWHTEDQLDLAQEIRVQLWRAFAKYQSTRSFSTWMYQVALNTAVSWSRRTVTRRHRMATAAELDAVPALTPSGDRSQELYALIETLNEYDRALLLLLIDERSHAEIAEILGITAGNVATKLSRLKQRLRIEADTE